ncbi:hypothetical protein [Luteibacter mycovicinus]|uniref:hypothetical protein n=1 Tax=Luteibacter mycovicinus TaxID=1500890 RepID=UPI000561B407|nr:hypothetical protein [Luteibacter sp. 9143a]
MPGYKAAGNDLENLYDPDVVGNGYLAAGLKVGGNAGTKYASAAYGTPGPYSGFNASGVGDVGKQWAAKGTAVYALSCNGQTFNDNNQSRGGAGFRFLVSANGTWQVQRWRSTSDITTVASGTWLTDGSSASQWSCSFDYTLQNQSTVGNASNGIDCDSPNNGNRYAMTADHYCRAYAQAQLTGTTASSSATIVLHLFKDGVKRSDTTIYTNQNVNGN